MLCQLLYPVSVDGQDTGANGLIDRIRNEFSNYLADAEKKIPRQQKYSILKRAKKLLDKQPEPKVELLLDLAHRFRWYLFYEESRELYERALNHKSATPEELAIANRYLGEMAVVEKEDIDAAISYMKNGLKHAGPESELRAHLLANLGSYYYVTDQIDLMKKTFDRFNRLPERVKRSLPNAYLKSNLYPGRMTDDPKEAEKYFANALQIVTDRPGDYDVGLVLGVFSERWSKKKWNSQDRIKALKRLIREPSYRNDRDLIPMAMDVFLASYLKCDRDWKEFKNSYDEVIKLIDRQEALTTGEADREDRDPDEDDIDVSACARQVIAMFAFASEKNAKSFDRNQLRNNFQKWNRGENRLTLYLPARVTREEILKFQNAYREGINRSLKIKTTRRNED